MPFERPVSLSQGHARSAHSGSFPRQRVALVASVLGLLAACGSGPSSGRQAGLVGSFVKQKSGAVIVVDPNESGAANKFELAEVFAARLVDVHAVVDEDPNLPPSLWVTDPEALFTDYAIGLDVASDGVDYRLETNPVTQRSRLVILREKFATFPKPTTPAGEEFMDLLRDLTDSFTTIQPKDDDGTSAPPFGTAPRNAALVLRFNDLIDASDPTTLADDVHVFSGYPPTVPYQARVFFDPNHGTLIADEFHPTRVILDLAITEAEANTAAATLIPNAVGLPASATSSFEANVSIRIPTDFDIASGQRTLLTSLSGRPLSTTTNDPVDLGSPTKDVVRALRSKNEEDAGGGFLADVQPPSVVGEWDVTVDAVTTSTLAGVNFELDVTFANVCRDTLRSGQIFQIGTSFLEVVVLGLGTEVVPDPMTGAATSVLVRRVDPNDSNGAAELLAAGMGTFLPTYSLASTAPDACWLRFQAPGPNATFDEMLGLWTGISNTAVPSVRFSEPMTPTAVTAFDSLLVVRGDENTTIDTTNVVVGTLATGNDLSIFRFQSTLPFDHEVGMTEDYHVLLDTTFRPTDLAGNTVATLPGPMGFQLDSTSADADNGGIVLRFNSEDEIPPVMPDTFTDLRGQLFYDFGKGTIKPRDVVFSSFPFDQTDLIHAQSTGFWAAASVNGVTALENFAPFSLRDPLNPFGSKVQTVWRYADFGWGLLDETKMNLDVVGLSWAPLGGIVSAELYQDFSIALAHSSRCPDEGTANIGMPAVPVTFPLSGLLGSPNRFEENVLDDPLSPQKIVHARTLGYTVSPVDRFTSSTGTTMLPFPMNRVGAPRETFLWRDTGALGIGGPTSSGVPLAVERQVGLVTATPSENTNLPYGSGLVPTIGLPLLLEFRCYPSQTALGLNNFGYLAQAVPPLSSGVNFRAFSSGGTNSQGSAVPKNPDFEDVPDGGFNPLSSPANLPTLLTADSGALPGQLDTVTRVSRAHSIWIDAGAGVSPTYVASVVEPDPSTFPTGTQFIVEYRGASMFSQNLGMNPFDSANLDPYGDLPSRNNGVSFTGTGASWKPSIGDIDGSRYMQLRFTWINNIDANAFAEVSALGFAFLDD